MTDVAALPDPRSFPEPGAAAPADARLHALAAQALAAATRQEGDAHDAVIRDDFGRRLTGDGDALAALFASAPSVAISRHLWRQLDAAWRDPAAAGGAALALALFAIPVVVVAGGVAEEGGAQDGILADPDALEAILREHGALGGSATFALSGALVGANALDLPRLPELRAWQRLPESAGPDQVPAPHALPAAPLVVEAGAEGAHLRFLVGSTIARAGADPFAAAEVGKWGVPFARELSRQLAISGATVLALPRAPQRPLSAVRAGRAAQREVGAQLFAGNAIRKLRTAAGEPAAVISAHRAPAAPGGGELRLSLSSPFAPRDAEGFRCPLYAQDRVADVATLIVDLLADCRVADVRIAPGVHPDRDPATGRTLFFKPDTLPGVAVAH